MLVMWLHHSQPTEHLTAGLVSLLRVYQLGLNADATGSQPGCIYVDINTYTAIRQ